MNINEAVNQASFPRSYRKCTTSSSLNPAIGYLMNMLAGLDPKDRLLDPCCGSGTILIERQLLKPCFCQGVDTDPRVLECAKKNIQAAGVEVNLKHGDIKDQKFPEGNFTKIISNLPYGIHSGSRVKNIELYRFLAQSSEKWLKKRGSVVLLTQSKKILWNAFSDKQSLKFISETPLQIRGLTPSIFIYQKI